jgi:hypothetical protein
MSKKSSFVKAVGAMSKIILRDVEEGSKKSVIIIASDDVGDGIEITMCVGGEAKYLMNSLAKLQEEEPELFLGARLAELKRIINEN